MRPELLKGYFTLFCEDPPAGKSDLEIAELMVSKGDWARFRRKEDALEMLFLIGAEIAPYPDHPIDSEEPAFLEQVSRTAARFTKQHLVLPVQMYPIMRGHLLESVELYT
jgi:hypothetical protein